jgi:septal ring-binding cell division protein DamX
MDYITRFTCVPALLIVMLLTSCGPSEEEQRQAELARQDSIAQAQKDSMQQLQQQRRDSLAQARSESMDDNGDSAANLSNVTFSPSGSFSVQVEAWRSQNKAQERADQWKERGFNNASVVMYGKKATGNIWYRVRLGRVQSRPDAQRLQEQLNQEYQAQSWIANPS